MLLKNIHIYSLYLKIFVFHVEAALGNARVVILVRLELQISFCRLCLWAD